MSHDDEAGAREAREGGVMANALRRMVLDDAAGVHADAPARREGVA